VSVDFPRAWEIARAAPAERHHPECSFRQTGGAILCDCAVVNNHPETLADQLHTAGGKLWAEQAASDGLQVDGGQHDGPQ
jgi:hypothetical protein